MVFLDINIFLAPSQTDFSARITKNIFSSANTTYLNYRLLHAVRPKLQNGQQNDSPLQKRRLDNSSDRGAPSSNLFIIVKHNRRNGVRGLIFLDQPKLILNIICITLTVSLNDILKKINRSYKYYTKLHEQSYGLVLAMDCILAH